MILLAFNTNIFDNKNPRLIQYILTHFSTFIQLQTETSFITFVFMHSVYFSE